jgi:radical SAM superfamily enzyme YgiQ (UPF0313 family)
MKIAFVYPGIVCTGYNSYDEYLGEAESLPIYGISLLAGVVKAAGHEVELLDLRQLKSEQELIDRLRATTAEVISVSIQTPSFNIACRVAELAKQFDKITIAGGIHATVAPEDFTQPYWDHVVLGDGEIILPQLLDGFSKGEKFDKILEGPMMEDLNQLPLPHFFSEWLPDYKRWYGLEAARGCYGRCTYCVSGQKKFFKKMRFRSNEHVMREIDHAYQHFQFKHLAFLDVNATAQRKNFNALLEMLAECYPELEVGIQDRPDTFNEETAELLSRFKGGSLIWFGFETGSPNMLKFLNKQVDLSTVKGAIDLCKKYGIKTAAMMIIGIPTETEEDILQTYDLVKYADPEILVVNILSPFPGTPLYDYCVENDLLPENICHERFHIRKIYERGLLKGIDYKRALEWQKRIHTLNLLGNDERDKVDRLVAKAKIEGKKLGIFCGGEHTSTLLAATRIRELNPVIFDNDIKKWGDCFEGIEVLPPRLIGELGIDIILISTKSFEEEIYQQLKAMQLADVEMVKIHG